MYGRFTHEKWDHPTLIRAREQGDPEMLARALASLTLPDGSLDLRGYVRLSRQYSKNMPTLEGKKRSMDLVTGVVSNADLSWYFVVFSSDSTPTAAWDGDSFAASGGDATEFTGYTASTRPECVFDAAVGTSRVTATNTTRATITISAGVSATVYGVGITNNSTKQYAGGSAILLRASRLVTPEVYVAGQVYPLAYQMFTP
jgi:hypothetical protein